MVASLRSLSLGGLLLASTAFGHGPHKRAIAPIAYESCKTKNDIALTFDDGPWEYLREISDAFTNAGAKATFFFNGNNWDCIYNPARYNDIKYAYAAGHQIGSHTWSHADLTAGLTNAQIQDAMYRVEEALSRIIGIRPAFMRPPYGDYNSNIESIAAGRNQALALWDWDTGDADGNTTSQSEALYNDIISSKVTNALVLEHETEQPTASTLVPFAINLFQSHGFNLVTLAECLGVAPYAAVGVPQTPSSSWTCDGTPDPGAVCGGSITCETGTPTLSTTSSTSSSTPPPTTGKSSQYIHPSVDAGMCLTAASNANGAAVEITPCITSGSSTSQNWTISSTGGNLVVFGNKCLDVTGGSAVSGNLLQIWTCTSGDANQNWSIDSSTGSISWTNKGFCMDLTKGADVSGTVMQIWACTPSSVNANKVFTITTGPGSGGGGTTPPPPTSGTFIKPSASSTKCLAAASNTAGTPVEIQDCLTSGDVSSQNWSVSGGNLVLYGNMCLDVTGGATADGTKLQIWTCTSGNTNQKWTVNSASNSITWTGHSDCLDLTNGSTANGNQVQIWGCSASAPGANQKWSIVST